MSLGDGKLSVGTERFDCRITMAHKNAPSEFETQGVAVVEPLPVIGRRAIKPGSLPENLTPEAVTPSSLHDENAVRTEGVVTDSYGAGVELTEKLEPTKQGLILHRCFEIMGSRKLSADAVKNFIGYGFTDQEFEAVSKAVVEFDAWFRNRFSPIDIAREVPMLALNSEGSVVSGAIDLFVETDKGLWIIDHKTDASEDLELLFARYQPQLRAYSDAVRMARPDKKILGMGINWIRYGKVMMK